MVRSVSGLQSAVEQHGDDDRCVDCGIQIPAERMAEIAGAPRCVRCESEQRRVQARPVTPSR